MGLHGKWFSERDLRLMHSINAELIGDVIQATVTLYKMSLSHTPTNIYGESDPSVGKMYFPGVIVSCLIDKDEIRAIYSEFGIDKEQPIEFRFREKLLKELNFYPQEGDLVGYNERYYECHQILQENYIGSIPEKSWDIIARTHYTRLSKISLVERQL